MTIQKVTQAKVQALHSVVNATAHILGELKTSIMMQCKAQGLDFDELQKQAQVESSESLSDININESYEFIESYTSELLTRPELVKPKILITLIHINRIYSALGISKNGKSGARKNSVAKNNDTFFVSEADQALGMEPRFN